MKTFLKTLLALTLATVLLLTGCDTTDTTNYADIYDSLTEQKSKEVEADPKTFTSEQLEYYKAILSPFDMAFGIASVPGLDFKSPEQISADRLVNFYYVNGFEGYLNEEVDLNNEIDDLEDIKPFDIEFDF